MVLAVADIVLIFLAAEWSSARPPWKLLLRHNPREASAISSGGGGADAVQFGPEKLFASPAALCPTLRRNGSKSGGAFP